MKNSFFRYLALIFAVLMISVSLTACGSSDATESMKATVNDSVGADTEISDTVADSDGSTDVRDDRKIIETIDLTVQTKEFDTLVEDINKKIADLGGYIESSDISGREIGSYDSRYAYLTIRIPAEKSKAFSGFISENSVVTNRAVSTEDVTLTYVDIESRVAALNAEKESLEKLLKEAESVNDIVTVRDKLTEVIYEIESYQSQLRTYDNLVDYSTVNISIHEVERTTVVEDQNVWQEIGTNLKNNFINLWNGLVELFIFVVSAIPYLLIPSVAGVILLIILLRKKSKKKAPKNQEQPKK